MRIALSIAIVAVAVLALSLSVTGGIPTDTDGDGVPDSQDNCLLYPNGPLAQHPSTPLCNSQMDGDLDGYGNGCDYDTDQNGATGLDDKSTTVALSVAVAVNAENDLNCDGAVGLDDVSLMVQAAASVAVPGPSGLACAGTIPCTFP